uniref:tRNA dimethylallyltransferase 2 isoform X1 n=1 Tax=Elaeis guineensis var. tenera TaxID=51953 RepID=A0A8N4EYF9_ELAGV|nr:tRNA dimethylallyltransferase 2 isoform X1 [Elaeis guineensis]
MATRTVDTAAPVEDPCTNRNPNGGRGGGAPVAKKVVVVMGATGAGKSRLAIDLASHFTGVEVVNADSMQVYQGLDVLTNKVPLSERNGVPHHLLGTIDASVEFTSKDFRDLSIPIIDDILYRGCLPVIVGGTNYYIQSLVSPFLIDDVVEDVVSCSMRDSRGELREDLGSVDSTASFDSLKELDPVAANRIHPNDHRKINRYLSLYASSGVLPSNLFQGEVAEKWGRADNFRYHCCFIWLDASLPVLDRYVKQRVDCMIDAGLLDEVYDIYHPEADYTRGLRQAIGVREFEAFFRCYFSKKEDSKACRLDFSDSLHSDDDLKILLDEATDKLKANTCKLARRQRRRLNRLKTCFGWDLHHVDVTEALSHCAGDSWQTKVVEPCVNIVRTFLFERANSSTGVAMVGNDQCQKLVSRDLWTQYVCEQRKRNQQKEMVIYLLACGNQILRGAHEWEQHKQGRRHRKRILRFKKRSPSSCSADQQQHLTTGETSCFTISLSPASADRSL